MLKEPGRHDQEGKLAPSFEEFKRAVLENLQSPLFAESSSSKPSQLSPATKELKRKEAYPHFTDGLLRASYQLLGEHLRLVVEQQHIRDIRKEYIPKLITLRNTGMTIASVKKRLEQLAEKMRGLVELKFWKRANDALSDWEGEVYEYHRLLSSLLHPALRQPPALSKVRWEALFKDYKYELPSLKKKAPDQWLYDALNEMLEKKLAKLELTKMTRYRIMSALLKPFGLNVQPITFKLHFESKKTASTSPVKKAQAT
jgi:hypothetical protein